LFVLVASSGCAPEAAVARARESRHALELAADFRAANGYLMMHPDLAVNLEPVATVVTPRWGATSSSPWAGILGIFYYLAALFLSAR
jgi:hypothetical protein